MQEREGVSVALQKSFCLRCMVSFSNEELHICEGRCRKCLQHYSNHDGTTVIEDGGKPHGGVVNVVAIFVLGTFKAWRFFQMY